MMEIVCKGLPSSYEVEHLIRIFYPHAGLRQEKATRGEVVYARMGKRRMAAAVRAGGKLTLRTAPVPAQEKQAKRALSRMVYDLLVERAGYRPPWGMLTGVRPVSLLRKTLRKTEEEGARRCLMDDFDVSAEKYAMIQGIARRQQPIIDAVTPRDYSLYVAIPFCPSRCDYCSFVSRTIEREKDFVQPYLDKLCEELAFTAALAAQNRLRLQSVYVGGGTPTALTAPQLEQLLQCLTRCFPLADAAEFTVEAGRPDCTDFEKLSLLRQYGVGRISINPQTMRDNVLQAIGRRHTTAQTLACFAAARKAGHTCINMDVIAGLPADDVGGFADTMEAVLALAPENVTVHALTMKRASNLVIDGRSDATSPAAMLSLAYPRLAAKGYRPYYLYRQKGTVENLENTGWALPGRESLYNIVIMEELHTILAAGAGAVSKLVGWAGTKIQRLFNYKFPADYIANFNEVLARKQGVNQFYVSDMDP